MSNADDQRNFSFEMLKRYGAKWAVFAAMISDMTRKGITIPPQAFEELRTARSKIESGAFSPCDVASELSQVESLLFSQCHLLDPAEFQEWSDLLAEAMQGKLDYQRIQGIPAFAPVQNECKFLGCMVS